jgi:hypothetical protein
MPEAPLGRRGANPSIIVMARRVEKADFHNWKNPWCLFAVLPKTGREIS